MIAQLPSEQPLKNYAIFANEIFTGMHCGVLPHPGGWVVFGNIGRDHRVTRLIDLICRRHPTGPLSWNEVDGVTFALLVLDQKVPNLMQLWKEACRVNDRDDEVRLNRTFPRNRLF